MYNRKLHSFQFGDLLRIGGKLDSLQIWSVPAIGIASIVTALRAGAQEGGVDFGGGMFAGAGATRDFGTIPEAAAGEIGSYGILLYNTGDPE